MAQSKRKAREAAVATLQRQAEASISVAENPIIRGISEQNAVASAQMLATAFVDRKPHEAPTWVAWDLGEQRYIGMLRTHNAACTTTAHACRLPAKSLQPAGAAIAWSEASLQYAPRSDDVVRVPGLLERLRAAAAMGERGGKADAVRASRMGATALGDAEPPRSTESSGIARSVLSFRATVDMSESQQDAARVLRDEACVDDYANMLAKKAAAAGPAAAARCGRANGGVDERRLARRGARGARQRGARARRSGWSRCARRRRGLRSASSSTRSCATGRWTSRARMIRSRCCWACPPSATSSRTCST